MYLDNIIWIVFCLSYTLHCFTYVSSWA